MLLSVITAVFLLSCIPSDVYGGTLQVKNKSNGFYGDFFAILVQDIRDHDYFKIFITNFTLSTTFGAASIRQLIE